MNYIIKNETLTVVINTLGAEIQSILKGDTQYLWQGDENSWKSRASNLFPYIGRLNNKKYTYKGNTYSLNTHGFLRATELIAENIKDDEVTLKMNSTEETLKQYPFEFELFITYKLEGDTLHTSYKVVNKDSKKMYFGLGGHPGFITPLESNLTLEDYYLEFDEPSKPNIYRTTKDCLIDYKEPYKLENDTIIRLKSNLFNDDALIFDEISKKVTLKSDKSNKSVTVTYNDMNFIAFWQTPLKAPNFICVEPWTSIQSRGDRIEDLETQENLLSLNPKSEYKNTFSITIKES